MSAPISRILINLPILGSALFFSVETSAKWDIQPALKVQELYTSNVDLLPSPLRRDEFVTEVTPYIAFNNQNQTNPLFGYYRVQGLYFAHDTRSQKLYQQALLNSQTYLYKKNLKLEVMGEQSQQVLFPDGRISVDNLRGDNQTNVTTVRLGPDFVHRLTKWMKSFWSYRYGRVIYHGSGIGDAQDHSASWKVQSQKSSHFDFANEVDWRQTRQSDARVSEVFTIFGTLGYRLSSKLRFYGSFGYEDNQGQATTTGIDGILWRIGLQYFPTKRLMLDGNFGERAFGNSYYARATWFKKHQIFSLKYEEEITNFFQNQLQQLSGARLEGLGTATLQFQPQFRRDLFVRKSVTLDWTIQGSKSYMNLQPYFEKRISQEDGRVEKGYGFNGEIGWTKGGTWTYSLLGGFSHQDLINQFDDKRFQVGAQVTQVLSPKTFIVYRYNHFELERTLIPTVTENSVSVSIDWQI